MTGSDTWCVYRPEWVRVYTSRCFGLPGREECEQVFCRAWSGKLAEGEWKVSHAVPDRSPHTWKLEVRLPTLKGEWKDRGDAERCREKLGRFAVVVPWGSAEERQLLDYGREPLTG